MTLVEELIDLSGFPPLQADADDRDLGPERRAAGEPRLLASSPGWRPGAAASRNRASSSRCACRGDGRGTAGPRPGSRRPGAADRRISPAARSRRRRRPCGRPMQRSTRSWTRSARSTGSVGGSWANGLGVIRTDQHGGLAAGGSGGNGLAQRPGRQHAAVAEPGAAVDHQERGGFRQRRILQPIVHQQDLGTGLDRGPRAGGAVGTGPGRRYLRQQQRFVADQRRRVVRRARDARRARSRHSHAAGCGHLVRTAAARDPAPKWSCPHLQ